MLERKTKSIIVLLLAGLMCFSVVGCSKKAAPETTPTTPTTPETTVTTPDTTATASSIVRPEGVPADYPSKEIHWIYGFGAGSPNDAYFRILADKIQKMEGWKNGFVIDYKEGASGRIGWNAIGEAKPDGYTIGFTPSAMLISAVSEDVSYGVDKMSFIFNTMSDPGAIGVVAGSKYTSLQSLIDDAKARPGEITIGVTSTIGQEGLTVTLIERLAGVKFNVVAFDGESEIFASIIGKHIDAFCLNVTDATTFLADNQVVVFATGGQTRSEFLPDVPTYKEAGYDVTQVNMRGIGGPKDIPEPIRQYLENCFIAAANDPEVKAKVAEMKIPVDSLPGTELKERFATISDGYAKLWAENPWQ